MKITLKNLISSTELVEYIFNIDGSCIKCIGKDISYRNNEMDIFGRDWDGFYKIPKAAEIEELFNSNEYEWADEDKQCDMYKEITDKYNPVLHKTTNGKPYYSGSYGASSYKLPWNETELKSLLIDEISCVVINSKLI